MSATVDSVTSLTSVLCPDDLEEVVSRSDGRHSRDSSSSSDLITCRSASVPLLHDVRLEIEDKDAAVVLVFPRKVSLVRSEVGDPLKTMAKIFRYSDDCDDGGASMSARDFERQIRQELVEKLVDEGFRLMTHESIDGEEVFLLVSLPRDGLAIRRLARLYSYRMPLRCAAYNHVREHIMTNDWGKEVSAYVQYEEIWAPWIEDFSRRDEVLLSKRRLDELLDLHELMRQGVVVRHFAAADFQAIVKLHRTWSDLRRMCVIPDLACRAGSRQCLSPASDMLDSVRDYYGEEVAFFYMWLARLIRWLAPLGAVGLLAAFAKSYVYRSQKEDRKIRLLFACTTVLWASLINKFWARASARMRQQWGISGELAVQPWSTVWSYRPELRGTWRHSVRSSFSYACPALYCIAFVLIIARGQPVVRAQLPTEFQNALPSMVVFLGLNLWSRIVPRVINLQNHELQARWNDSLTWFLAPVKLFLALWPFLYIAFFKRYREKVAPGDSGYDQTLDRVGKALNASECGALLFPGNGTINHTYVLGLLRSEDFALEDGTLYGCWPEQCSFAAPSQGLELSEGAGLLALDRVHLNTNCLMELQMQLFTFYVINFAAMLGLVIAPIILARCTMKSAIIRETLRASKRRSGREAQDVQYSLLQFQSKCHELAEYAYWSWGGSWVENFMEPAIVLAHLQCFCIINPGLPAAAFVALMLEYRLMAYRHNNVTCRNWPYASQGIGAWHTLFRVSSFLAIFCIVCKVTLLDDEERLFDMSALERQFGLAPDKVGDHRLGDFIVLQTLMFGLQFLVTLTIPGEPDDVGRIGRFNAEVITKLKMKEARRASGPTPESACTKASAKATLLRGLDEESSASSDSAQESLSGSTDSS